MIYRMNLFLVMLPFCSAYLDWPLYETNFISEEEVERRLAVIETTLTMVGIFVVVFVSMVYCVVCIAPNARRARLARQTVVVLEDKC